MFAKNIAEGYAYEDFKISFEKVAKKGAPQAKIFTTFGLLHWFQKCLRGLRKTSRGLK